MFAKLRKDAILLVNDKVVKWPTAIEKSAKKEQMKELFEVIKLYENRRSVIKGSSFPNTASVSRDFLDIQVEAGGKKITNSRARSAKYA